MRDLRCFGAVPGVAVVFLPLFVLGAEAAGTPPIAGQYVCEAGCRLTDAAPSIAIQGQVATCMNELGGVYIGQKLTDTAVACFRMTGTLSEDGRKVMWSNGNVWRRR